MALVFIRAVWTGRLAVEAGVLKSELLHLLYFDDIPAQDQAHKLFI